MANLITKLMLETGAFSSNIATAQQQITSFERGVNKAKGGIEAFSSGIGINIGSLTKLGSVIGAASLAAEGFQKFMEANDEVGDKYAETMAQATAQVDSFFKSLYNSGGITDFIDSWDKVNEAAQAHAQALDDCNTWLPLLNQQLEVHKNKYESLLADANNVSLTENERIKALRLANIELDKSIVKEREIIRLRGAKARAAFNESWHRQKDGKQLKDLSDKTLAKYASMSKTEIEQYNINASNKVEALTNEYWKLKNAHGVKNREAVLRKKRAEIAKWTAARDYSGRYLKTINDGDTGAEVVAGVMQTQMELEASKAREAQARKAAARAEARIHSSSKKGRRHTKKHTKKHTTKHDNKEQKLKQEQQNHLKLLQEDFNASVIKNKEEGQFAEESQKKAKEVFDYQKKIYKEGTVEYKQAVNARMKYLEELADYETKKLKESAEESFKAFERKNTLLSTKSTQYQYTDEGHKEKQAEYDLLIEANSDDNEKVADLKYQKELDNKRYKEHQNINKSTESKDILDDSLFKIDLKFDESKDKQSELLAAKIDAYKAYLEELRQLVGEENDIYKESSKEVNKVIAKTEKERAKAEGNENAQELSEQYEGLGAIVSSVGGAFGSLSSIMEENSTEAKVFAAMEIAAQAAVAIISAIGVATKSSKTWWELPVAIATAVGATVAAIAQFSKFEDGGIVGGSSYHGDRVIARVNSGEMILNGHQQARLFNMINGRGGTQSSSGDVHFKISGDSLVGVLDNYNKKRNKVR